MYIKKQTAEVIGCVKMCGVLPNGSSSNKHTVFCRILECVQEVPTSIQSMDF